MQEGGHGDPDPETEGATEFIFHHVQDAYEWHFITIGHSHITLPLPVILFSQDRGLEAFMTTKFHGEDHNYVPYNGYRLSDDASHIVAEDGHEFYDFSITKNVFAMFISVVVMLLIFLSVANRYKGDPRQAPKGLQSLLEPIILFIRDDIARPVIGDKKYLRFMPYLLTVFFFILVNNLLGLLPGAANVTGNISVTFVLAIITFFMTQFNGNKGYWNHIFNTPGVPKWLLPIMIPVEIIGLFTKPFSLMVRLFANITAGHIIILSLIALIFIFESVAIGPVSVIFGTIMTFLELLVAFLQAYVFTLLSAIYFGGAVEEHHHAHEGEDMAPELQQDSAMI
uniref:ATP synthase subunit a n=1 Tax=Roseihalotalea indica TaxID=2867963 RepID=A0AA49GS02_9BACT|nr:F0F1 ATP synthase subunit A [Tunicatimonas sp. TK19036]